MSRRRFPVWILAALFVAVPLMEIWTIIQVGQVIGPWWTILLLVAAGIAGSWLVKNEGRRAWAALRSAIETGRMPSRELADGALILVGGTLMVSPGFVTDIVGILLILPLTRPLARSLLTQLVAKRVMVVGPTSNRPGPPTDGSVVRGEVID